MLANLVLPDGSRTGLNAIGEPSDKFHSRIRVIYWKRPDWICQFPNVLP